MTLSACVPQERLVLDSKCETIKESEITDAQVDRLYYGDEDDRRLLKITLANDEILYKDCRMPLDKVDGSVIDNTGGEVTPADGSISAAKLASNAVTTVKITNNNVTKAKLEQAASMRVLGNTTGSTANVAEVIVYDEDNMASNSATGLATQQSIKAYVDAALGTGLTKSFTSSDQTMTLAGGLTLAHGMGIVPKLVNLQAVCQTAEGNYATSDVVYDVGASITGNVGVAVYADATNVYCRVGSTNFANMINKTTGASFVPTLANWKLRVRAFA